MSEPCDVIRVLVSMPSTKIFQYFKGSYEVEINLDIERSQYINIW